MTTLAKLPMALMILLSGALTGCGNERVRITPAPVELTTCADEPAAPDLPAQTPETQRARDTMTLDYILALRSAWGDCFAKVAGVNAWNEALK